MQTKGARDEERKAEKTHVIILRAVRMQRGVSILHFIFIIHADGDGRFSGPQGNSSATCVCRQAGTDRTDLHPIEREFRKLPCIVGCVRGTDAGLTTAACGTLE